jgi:hypothetical protein
MVTKRNGMGEPDDPMDDGEYQRVLEEDTAHVMNSVEILLEDGNYRNFRKEND